MSTPKTLRALTFKLPLDQPHLLVLSIALLASLLLMFSVLVVVGEAIMLLSVLIVPLS